jgi:hypothetical protein
MAQKAFYDKYKNEVNLLLSALSSHVHIIILVPSFPQINNIVYLDLNR